jgi:transcriptional regulator with XRE-family HTH domain
MKTNKTVKLLEEISSGNSEWFKDKEEREKKSVYLSASQQIAIEMKRAIRESGESQESFAKKMGVKPQRLSKILKGDTNFTLETIKEIESCFGIKILIDLKTARKERRNLHLSQISLLENTTVNRDLFEVKDPNLLVEVFQNLNCTFIMGKTVNYHELNQNKLSIVVPSC